MTTIDRILEIIKYQAIQLQIIEHASKEEHIKTLAQVAQVYTANELVQINVSIDSSIKIPEK